MVRIKSNPQRNIFFFNHFLEAFEISGRRSQQKARSVSTVFFGVEPNNTTAAAKPRFFFKIFVGVDKWRELFRLVEVGTRWGPYQL